MTSTNPSPATPGSTRSVWFVGVTAVFVSLLVSGVLTGGSASIVDTDGFMRMTRIGELWSGDVGWWDGFAYRSNAPFGHSMHWTRPLDALVILLSLPAMVFMDADAALRLGGLAAGPLVLGLVAGTMTWAVQPLLGRVGAIVAGLGVALQPTLLAYGSPGRVDHHGLIFLVTVLLLGLGLRLAARPADRGVARWAGFVAGAGIWVSTELLLPVAVFLVAFLLAWVVSGSPRPAVMRTFALAWAAATAAALVIERAPDLFVSRDLDRISLAHLLVAVLAGVFWTVVTGLRDDRSQSRALAALAAGAITGVVLWIVVPSFVAGPFGDVPPALWDAWLSKVAELQPLWPFGPNPARSVYLLAAPVIGVVLAVWAGSRDPAHRAVWWGIAGAIAALVALGMAQARFTAYSQLLATVAWGWLAATLVAHFADRRGVGGSLLRVGSMLAGVAGFLVPVLALAVLPGSNDPAPATETCEIESVIEYLNERGGAPVVLTHVDWGPEILYRTEASVLASPYHRNVDGILDERRFLGGLPSDAARIAAERSVDVVAVCAGRDADYLASDRTDGDLLSLIAGGQAPSWLVSQPIESDIRLFEVDHSRLP